MKKIRVGIVGQGRSGFDIHVRSLRAMPETFTVAAVADPIAKRCAEAKKELGAAAYTDYRKMLKDRTLDLIVNASPSHLHVPISKEALDLGFNVLCEKPLARRAKDVDMLIATAKKRKKALAVYQQSRFAPYYEQVKKVIASGVLGRVVMVKIAFNGFGRRWDWQTLQEFSGGSLLNTGPHPLDQALEFVGRDRMPQVFCIMDRVNTFGDAEDHVKLILRSKGRPTVDLEISACAPYTGFTYQLYAQYGGLTGTTASIQWKYYRPKEAPKQRLTRTPLPGRKYCGETLVWHEESWEQPKDTDLFMVMSKKLYGSLYARLTGGTPLVVTPEQVRQQIAVIEECHRQNPLSRK